MYIKSLIKRLFILKKTIFAELGVFIFAIAYRLPSLGYDFINNDAFHWKERGYAFGSAIMSLDFAKTAVTYHPGVSLLWSQFIAIKTYSILNQLGYLAQTDRPWDEFWTNNYIQSVTVVCFTSLLIAFLYRPLQLILGRKIAIISIVFLLFEPFYLALSRTIHTDAIITLSISISILYFYVYLFLKDKKNYGIIAGVFAGIALLTKSSALFLLPFFLFSTLYLYFFEKEKNTIQKFLLVLFFAAAAFIVFWPAMWVDPIGSINLYLFKGIQGIAIDEGHEHYWFGRLTLDPGPLFYPVVMIGRYTLTLVLSAFAAIYLIFKNRRNTYKKDREYIFLQYLGVFILSYLLMVTLASKKLDRYSLPVVVPLSILAAWVLVKLSHHSKKIIVSVATLIIISRIVLFYGIHPNYLAYYSPLVGGIERGMYILEPKWLVGYDEVAEYFNRKQEEKGTVLKVAIADYDYLRPFANFETLNIKHEVERDMADYFVLPVYRKERNKYYTDVYELERLGTTIKIAGVDYYYIYEVKGKK